MVHEVAALEAAAEPCEVVALLFAAQVFGQLRLGAQIFVPRVPVVLRDGDHGDQAGH